MPQGGIDKRAIARMMKDIQREFDKHPIKVPLRTERPRVQRSGFYTGGLPEELGTTVYNGPVIMGNADGAQLAWGNQTVNQTINQTEQIAPGFEVIAQAVVGTLEQLPAAGLSEEDQADAEATANEVLVEVTQPAPDRGKIRRALSALKGYLAPVATGLVVGGGEGAQEWAKTAIEQLGMPF
jgi:hypothetical protein